MTAYLTSECEDGNFGAWAIEYDGLHLYHQIITEDCEFHNKIEWDEMATWSYIDCIDEGDRFNVLTKDEVDAIIFERRL